MISDELRRYYASAAVECVSELHEILARNLVSIAESNAHSYNTRNSGTVNVSIGDMILDSVALYVLGSKIEHSCAPNLSYRNTEIGMLEYLAETPLVEGDRLTFSYAPTIYETPRKERHNFLETNKQLCVNTNGVWILMSASR